MIIMLMLYHTLNVLELASIYIRVVSFTVKLLPRTTLYQMGLYSESHYIQFDTKF